MARLLREYIRALLTEDPMGFVHDLAAASEEFGEEGEEFFGGDPGDRGGKAIKRAFNANADHAWLATLNTVHWKDPYVLDQLQNSGKDELSTSMSLPGDALFHSSGYGSVGLWVKGRITLATNDQDSMYSGVESDYRPKTDDTEELKKYLHKKDSSGINKRPMTSKDYSRYGKLEKGTEFGEKTARKIPYVLDQTTWNPEETYTTNEALVDNWKAVGIVVGTSDLAESVKAMSDRDWAVDAVGITRKIFKLARDFGAPIVDTDRNKLWEPDDKIKETVLRASIREMIMEQEVKFSGILKLMPSPAIVSSVSSLLQQLPPEAIPLPEDKFHVTLAHQSVLKPYKKQLKQLSKDGMLPPPPKVTLEGDVEERADEALDRKSWVVWVKNQDELKTYMQDVMKLVDGPPGDPEPSRRFHVSIANLTGNPGDSVR